MPQGYLSSIEEVAAAREDLGREGRKLVLTNGAFDVLHVGHVRYLREAAALGDCLVVAINGDDSVRELKGEGRPVNGVEDRAEMLCALEFVDRVVVFEDRRATGVIEAIQPHIYTKGGITPLTRSSMKKKRCLIASESKSKFSHWYPVSRPARH